MAEVKRLKDRLDKCLLFAVPKKGRLNQDTLHLLEGSDIKFRRDHRSDIAFVRGLDIALVFLPAADIPAFVGEGKVALGITGRDQVLEHRASLPGTDSDSVDELLDLGFGDCKLQVQVPVDGPLQAPEDLLGKDIRTSFVDLTREYFLELEKKSESDAPSKGERRKTNIRYVSGSVEAACVLGLADGIVDLVESGETMRAAGLKAIATVAESTAVLIKSKSKMDSEKALLVDLIVERLKGVITAQKYVLCQYNVQRPSIEAATAITPGMRGPTISSLELEGWAAVSVMVKRNEIAGVMDNLTKIVSSDRGRLKRIISTKDDMKRVLLQRKHRDMAGPPMPDTFEHH